MTAKKDNDKTNAMRILESEGIHFIHLDYEAGEFIDGAETADKLGLPHEKVYKTLVTTGADKKNYVFVIPIDEELDLKKCAKAVNVKSVEMLHVKDLFRLTGYVRGGCSPIGMKKQFVTVIDSSVLSFTDIYISAGKIGSQLSIAPDDLIRVSGAYCSDIVRR
ncbi:MAG: Cys-tRNA(Pro) deacylase [Eubacteriaceae bacterium]|nr:Cys-tRNA(Pro) deacylase [Eubacteriaceae bacterium]